MQVARYRLASGYAAGDADPLFGGRVSIEYGGYEYYYHGPGIVTYRVLDTNDWAKELLRSLKETMERDMKQKPAFYLEPPPVPAW
jgi:hypothetical protein